MANGLVISESVRASYFTLRFQNAPDDERAFLEDYYQRTIGQIRICFFAAIILVALFGFLDGLIVPTVKQKMWTIRYGFICPLLIVFLAINFTSWAKKTAQYLISLGMVVTGLGIVSMITIAPPPGDHLYYAGLLLLFIYLPTCRARFIYSAATVWTLIAIYEVAAFFFTSTPPELLISNNFFFISSALIAMFTTYILEYYARKNYVNQIELEKERNKSEHLLLNILPITVADRLKKNPGALADGYAEATVLFADIVGFTHLAANRTPHNVVDLLNRIFTEFDHIAEKWNIEKIKTVGDAYMAAAGLPIPRPDHAEAIANMALDLRDLVARSSFLDEGSLSLRIGINTGPVVAGVIGKNKYIYDIWGDTVNTASRMESHGVPGEIHVTEETYSKLSHLFELKERGTLDIKGKGMLRTYFLTGKKSGIAP